jgi:hypothetical protein
VQLAGSPSTATEGLVRLFLDTDTDVSTGCRFDEVSGSSVVTVSGREALLNLFPQLPRAQLFDLRTCAGIEIPFATRIATVADYIEVAVRLDALRTLNPTPTVSAVRIFAESFGPSFFDQALPPAIYTLK